ncbi:MAG: fibrobacter succinogenes major paralogous domain-containing protein [Flavobacteriales bacterium]
MLIHSQEVKQYVYLLDGSVSIENVDSLDKMTFENDNVVLTRENGESFSTPRAQIDLARMYQFSSLHTCWAENVHNPAVPNGSMMDQQGNSYKTIVIGEQEWMAENLNTSLYRNGEAIPEIESSVEWSSTQSGAYCHFDNISTNACPYGKLYNWYACVNSRQLCPQGWHIPSDSEWSIVANYLGGSSMAGSAMKSLGSVATSNGLWLDSNLEATNNSGFSGIPGGYRSLNGSFTGFGLMGIFWSRNTSDSDGAYSRGLYATGSSVERADDDRPNGYSVRCIKD